MTDMKKLLAVVAVSAALLTACATSEMPVEPEPVKNAPTDDCPHFEKAPKPDGGIGGTGISTDGGIGGTGAIGPDCDDETVVQ